MDFYRPESDSPTDRDRHSQSYIDAGLGDQNLEAEFPILQGWLADRNLGTRIDQAQGLTVDFRAFFHGIVQTHYYR